MIDLFLLVGIEDQHLFLGEVMLIAVVARTAAINHQEIIPLFDRQHRVVPDAAMVINALPAITAEGTDQA
jgi:K+ transporter